MIAAPSGVRVLMATKPVDFRKGANGLAALIKDEMKADPFSGVGEASLCLATPSARWRKRLAWAPEVS